MLSGEGVSSTSRLLCVGNIQPVGVIAEVKLGQSTSDLQRLKHLANLHVAHNSKVQLGLEFKGHLISDMHFLLYDQQSFILVDPNIIEPACPCTRVHVFDNNSIVWVRVNSRLYKSYNRSIHYWTFKELNNTDTNLC